MIFLTEIRIKNDDGSLSTFGGNRINAPSIQIAKQIAYGWVKQNPQWDSIKVIGGLISEQNEKEPTATE